MDDLNAAPLQSAPKKLSLIDLLILKKQLVVTILVVIAVAAAGVFGWMQKQKADEEQASLALAKVTPWIETANADKAIKGLNSIVSSYGDTPSGNLARLYLATIYYTLDRPGDALPLYNAVKSPNKDVQASAQAGAAACNVQQRAFEKAAAGYEQASGTAENEALKAMYLNKAAENDIAANQPDKAVKLLDRIIKTWPASSSAAVAQRTMWRLSGQGVQVVIP